MCKLSLWSVKYVLIESTANFGRIPNSIEISSVGRTPDLICETVYKINVFENYTKTSSRGWSPFGFAGESYVELRLSVRDDSELENLDKEFSALSCEDQSTPDSLDEVDSAVYCPDQACPPPFKCTCRSVEDTIRESILVASGEMQKCMIQGKLDEWKSYEATINNCIVWLQELRKMGCSLCQVKTGCVILRVRCSKLGLDFLWHGVSSGQFSRELAAIFRDLYAEMKGITIQIDVTINPVENGSVCAQMTDAATATACSGKFMDIAIKCLGNHCTLSEEGSS